MYLEHHGIKGQRWGVRRYRNYDGSLTSEGKKRYNGSVFISGSSKTQQQDSTYFRKELPKEIRYKIDGYIKNNNKILVGEAPGIDSQVQDYLNKKNYRNVDVYTSYNNPRYLANQNWNVKRVNPKGYKPDSPEFLRQKDIAMTNDADAGLSIILDNGGAGATRNNVKRLINQNKKVEVYMLDANSKNDAWVKDIIEEVGDEILHNDKTLYYNYLQHHGILGQKWGKKNGPPYPLGASDHSAAEKKAGWRKSLDKDNNKETKEKKKFHLSDKQKKYLKIGAAVTATVLVTAGTVYLAKKTGAYDKGKEFVNDILGLETKNINEPKTSSERIKCVENINPTHSKTNCGSTSVVAMENQRNGNKWEALPEVPEHMRIKGGKGYDPDKLIECFEGGKWGNKIHSYGNNRQEIYTKAKKEILAHGEGSKGILYLERRRPNLPGHYYQWNVANGEIVILEGQPSKFGIEWAGDQQVFENVFNHVDCGIDGEKGVRIANLTNCKIKENRRKDLMRPRNRE